MDFVEWLIVSVCFVVLVAAAATTVVPLAAQFFRHRKTFRALTEYVAIQEDVSRVGGRYSQRIADKIETLSEMNRILVEAADWDRKYKQYLEDGRYCICEKCQKLAATASEKAKLLDEALEKVYTATADK